MEWFGTTYVFLSLFIGIITQWTMMAVLWNRSSVAKCYHPLSKVTCVPTSSLLTYQSSTSRDFKCGRLKCALFRLSIELCSPTFKWGRAPSMDNSEGPDSKGPGFLNPESLQRYHEIVSDVRYRQDSWIG